MTDHAEDYDADTLTEVVDRVRESYLSDAEKRLRTLSAQFADAQQLADSRIAEAERSAGQEAELRRQMTMRVHGRINATAGACARAAFAALWLLVAAEWPSGSSAGLTQLQLGEESACGRRL
ncbi:MAG: hypothetical protein ABI211_04205 [Vicinamibacterales bacterium]